MQVACYRKLMDTPLTPFFTEEHGLFYLWRPEPQANKIQLAGEFKTEARMQERSLAIFGYRASARA